MRGVPAGAASARRLVAACLLPRREQERLAALATSADCEAALALAGAHLVAEPVANALLGLPAGIVAAPLRDRLGELSAAAAAKNGLLLGDLVRAQEVLRGAGIPSAALKGAALLAMGHCPLAARHLSDVDLLVCPRDVPRAAAALAGAGLAPPKGVLPALDGRSDGLGRNPGTAHLQPVEAWSGGLLELHDRLAGGGPGADEVIAAAAPVTWAGHRADVPALVDLAGMLCRHALVAHADEPRLRARHVADLAALEAAGVDWGEVRRRYGGGVVRESLALLAAAWREAEEGVPAPARLALLAPAGPAWRVRARWRALRSSQLGLPLRAQARSLFPAPAYMRARYGLAPDAPLSAVWPLYPRRILAGTFRLLVRR